MFGSAKRGRPQKTNKNPQESQDSQESQGSIADLLADLQFNEEDVVEFAGAEAPNPVSTFQAVAPPSGIIFLYLLKILN